jgi:hypothetical protein
MTSPCLSYWLPALLTFSLFLRMALLAKEKAVGLWWAFHTCPWQPWPLGWPSEGLNVPVLACVGVCICIDGGGTGGEGKKPIYASVLANPFWAGCKLISLLFSCFDLCIGLMGFVSLLLIVGWDLAGRAIKMLGDLHALSWLSCILYRIVFRWIVSVGLCSFVFWGSEVTSKTSQPAAWCNLW